MLELLKIIHYLAFSVGIGGGVATALLSARMRAAEPATAAAMGAVQRRIGLASFTALILLWITGPWMLVSVHGGGAGLGWAFWLKLLAVLVLTAAALAMQWQGLKASRAGTPPPLDVMSRLGQVSGLAAVLAVVFAVIAFA